MSNKNKDEFKTKETEAPRVSIDDIRLAIVEDKNKLMLLNIFDHLINENKVLNQ